MWWFSGFYTKRHWFALLKTYALIFHCDFLIQNAEEESFQFKQLPSILQWCSGNTTSPFLDVRSCWLMEVLWDPCSLHEESLSEAPRNTGLWIILSLPLSSGEANRILPFILMVFVLAAWTLALLIPFPTINTASAHLPFPCSPLCLCPFFSCTAYVPLAPGYLNSLY